MAWSGEAPEKQADRILAEPQFLGLRATGRKREDTYNASFYGIEDGGYKGNLVHGESEEREVWRVL